MALGRAFGRKIRVEVRTPVRKSTSAENTYEWDSVELDNLDVDFTITRTRRFNDNSAELHVYNMNRDTINRFLRYGSTILIYGGYEEADNGELGLLFSGNVIEAKNDWRDVDCVTTIKALSLRSLDKPFTATPIALSYDQCTADKPLKQIAEALGLVTYGFEDLKKVNLYWVYYVGGTGNALELLSRLIRIHGYGLYIDCATLFVYRLDGGNVTQVLGYLSPDSGLTSISDITDYYSKAQQTIDYYTDQEKVSVGTGKKVTRGPNKGKEKTIKVWRNKEQNIDIVEAIDKELMALPKKYQVTTLMMPKLKPNGLVHLEEKRLGINALLVIDQMTINGSNYEGGSFDMQMDLIEKAEQDVVEDME